MDLRSNSKWKISPLRNRCPYSRPCEKFSSENGAVFLRPLPPFTVGSSTTLSCEFQPETKLILRWWKHQQPHYCTDCTFNLVAPAVLQSPIENYFWFCCLTCWQGFFFYILILMSRPCLVMCISIRPSPIRDAFFIDNFEWIQKVWYWLSYEEKHRSLSLNWISLTESTETFSETWLLKFTRTANCFLMLINIELPVNLSLNDAVN